MGAPFSKVLRRIHWRATAVFVVLQGLVVTLGLTGLLGGGIQIAIWLGLVPAAAVYWAPRARLRRRLRECGFRLCPDCEQSLAGLPDRGRCPECGRAYDIGKDRTAWAVHGFPAEERGV